MPHIATFGRLIGMVMPLPYIAWCVSLVWVNQLPNSLRPAVATGRAGSSPTRPGVITMTGGGLANWLIPIRVYIF